MTTGAHFNPPTWKLEAKSKINTEHTQKKKSDHETKKKKMLSKSEKMKQINPNNWPQYNTKQKAIAASKLDSIKDKIQRQPNGRDPIEFSWKTDRNASWNRLDMNHETSFRFVGNATANWFNLSVKSTTSWQYSSCSPVPGGGGGGGGRIDRPLGWTRFSLSITYPAVANDDSSWWDFLLCCCHCCGCGWGLGISRGRIGRGSSGSAPQRPVPLPLASSFA